MIDLEHFEHTAAWLEHCDGMTRFAAETEAARRQGAKRWEAINEIRKRDFEGQRNNRQATIGQSANNLPGMQPHPAKEKRPVPVGHVSAGWGAVVLLALQLFGGGMV